MKPIPGTITDRRVDKVLYKADPTPKITIELTEYEASRLRALSHDIESAPDAFAGLIETERRILADIARRLS